jgi:hypothetical protein
VTGVCLTIADAYPIVRGLMVGGLDLLTISLTEMELPYRNGGNGATIPQAKTNCDNIRHGLDYTTLLEIWQNTETMEARHCQGLPQGVDCLRT